MRRCGRDAAGASCGPGLELRSLVKLSLGYTGNCAAVQAVHAAAGQVGDEEMHGEQDMSEKV